jgi:hypothetical protein
MEPNDLLDRVRIAAPCQTSWDAMEGDERMRFCTMCRKHVYNIAAMTSAEAETLIERSGDDVCARLYRRADGTVLTADCRVGLKLALYRRLRRFAACVALFAGTVAGVVSPARAESAAQNSPLPQPGKHSTVSQAWIDWALDVLGFRPRPPRAFLGRICRPPTPQKPGQPG